MGTGGEAEGPPGKEREFRAPGHEYSRDIRHNIDQHQTNDQHRYNRQKGGINQRQLDLALRSLTSLDEVGQVREHGIELARLLTRSD